MHSNPNPGSVLIMSTKVLVAMAMATKLYYIPANYDLTITYNIAILISSTGYFCQWIHHMGRYLELCVIGALKYASYLR